ncbi:MAG TPA: hypothetical protein PK530_11760 [Anaerolineales bacterium]|nr:hypothetical protein [Anaerolineales bacterium]
MELLKQLGIQPGAPVIVFKGGKTEISGRGALARVIHEGIARPAVEMRANVVDGGVDVGSQGLLNAALRDRFHRGYYIGVAPEAVTYLPGQRKVGDRLPLGDAHTHFILVEGEQWGAETSVRGALIQALAEKALYLKISMKHEREPSDENQPWERLYKAENGTEKIALQICYPGIDKNTNLEKVTREEVFSVSELDLDPEKLATRVRFLLNIYSARKKES